MLEHFRRREFNCPCCHEEQMDEDFLTLLDRARDIAAVKFSIISGYRCCLSDEAQGCDGDSPHTHGIAADIEASSDEMRGRILFGLIEAGFKRIGLSRTFIHIDTDRSRPSRVWIHGRL